MLQTVKKLIELISPLASCIIVFGSKAARDEAEREQGLSDIDILIVTRRRISKKLVRRLLITLNQYIGCTPSSIFMKIATLSVGAFRCMFLTDREYLENTKFSNVFNVSKLLSYLAPKGLVFRNIIMCHRVLQGNCTWIKKLKIKIARIDLVKSIILSAIVTHIGLLCVLTRAICASLYYEGIKWFFINVISYANPQPCINGSSLKKQLAKLYLIGIVSKDTALTYYLARRGVFEKKLVLRSYIEIIKLTIYVKKFLQSLSRIETRGD